jgi:2-polyprenyl-6-methoxyphenol hydroxylase-like FAD-dependent oxidoreductase
MSGTSPVAVIGNGPVGQTGALLLAGWGLPVVLLDRRPARDPVGSRSICQQRDVLDVWDSAGAGAIAREGLTWTTARTYYRDRELFSWQFVDRGRSPLPPFVNISQARTEEILDERIAATPGIEVRWAHEVVALAQDADGVTLTCDTPDGRRSFRAAYALACAGAHGDAVRGMLGVSFGGRSFDDCFLICDIRADLPGWERERRFYFGPAWNGWAPEALLDSYHHERLAAALENLEITDATMRFLVPQSAEERARRLEILDRAVEEPHARRQVDSGRMAEPFWYVDSPLTTPNPARPNAGRPPKGETPPVAPGVLVPDAPVRLARRPDVVRLRQLVRAGLLALTTAGVDAAALAATLKRATDAPAEVLPIADIDVGDAVSQALAARPGEAWLIRPDGHVAAVLAPPTAAAMTAAVCRLLGRPTHGIPAAPSHPED